MNGATVKTTETNSNHISSNQFIVGDVSKSDPTTQMVSNNTLHSPAGKKKENKVLIMSTANIIEKHYERGQKSI